MADPDTAPVERPSRWARQLRGTLLLLLRAIPIRWRILSIAALNSIVVIVLSTLIWNGAQMLGSAWDDLRQIRESDKVLTRLESQTSRLQHLIHRYINQPDTKLFAEIHSLRDAVLNTLNRRITRDPMIAAPASRLERATEQFMNGFAELRSVQAAITRIYEEQVLAAARDMSGLYAIIESASATRDSNLRPALGKSREAFTSALVAANAYYLSLATASAEDARRNAETIVRTVPVMEDLAENDLQRQALQKLQDRATALREGLAHLIDRVADRTALLGNKIDASQEDAKAAIDELSSQMYLREQKAQQIFDRTLSDTSRQVVSIAAILLGIILATGVVIAISIRMPLQQIIVAMRAISSGDLNRKVVGVNARDEVGAMARAVEVFRENAIAKQKAEEELRSSKVKAEDALRELNDAQRNLIDAERLAALGGLVAGVAHEVNNPIGISLTVASSLAQRTDNFETALKSEAGLRRSQLEEFVRSSRDASQQLVSNLQRAGELIQSFKQVAVDRSHIERRRFVLNEVTEQILASLQPALKRTAVRLSADVVPGIVVDGYPGAYGQILTNLVLNAINHAFRDGRAGTISLTARPRGSDDIEIVFADDGAGMSPEVQQRAFDPFFTTRRDEGGTGLGLHIVYNLVTQQLGGRLMLESRLGQGTTFRIIMPRTATGGGTAAADREGETSIWPNRTMSST